ncbi:MAG: hypothetical protein F4W90_00130 [Gammaproteobacteria bacterium]|nr:hypothetical protein [Gammaproteobacteria bacterium]
MKRLSARCTCLFSAYLLTFSLAVFGANPNPKTASDANTTFETITLKGSSDGSQRALVVPRKRSDIDIVVDGVIDEAVWASLPAHEEFYLTDPDTLEPATLNSFWRFFYTDRGFYVAANCQQDPTRLVERLSARDLGFLNRDYVSFTLDTSGEARYGYWFQLNLGGSRSDGTIQPERQFSDSWDGAWYGETARTQDGWSAEFFIPWSIVSMPKMEGEREMGIVMQRRVAYLNERYGYPPLPFTKPKFLSAFQKIVLQDVKPRQQLSFFPQVSSLYDSMNETTEGHAGLDLFWRPSTNLQVTATANPDFGTVEADSVIINLSAIETFFPEKRLFFLEGQEIFAPVDSSIRMLHTRRIGQRPLFPELPAGARFDYDQFRDPADLLGATKATGQIGKLRYGVLGAVEDDTTFYGELDGEPIAVAQPGRDFGVVRTLWEESNGDYRSLGFTSTSMHHPSLDARTHGLDGHFFSKSGKYKVDSQLFVSDVQGEENGYGGFVKFEYAQSQGVTHEFEFDSYDDKLNLNHLGYMARNDKNAFEYEFRIRKFSDRYKESDTEFMLDHEVNGAGQAISSSLQLTQEFTFNNNTRFRVRARYRPDQYDDRNSFGNGTYLEESRQQLDFRYSSDSARRFYYSASGGYGSESLGGASKSAGTFLIYRASHRFTMFSSIFYFHQDSWLLNRGGRNFTTFASESWSPRFGMDLFVTSKQHVRMDLEWSAIKALESEFYELPENDTKLMITSDPTADRADDFTLSRLNLQLRYRWEIAPMSDLFVVYSKRASLPNALGYAFTDLFSETLDHPISEGVVVKLRHHLGT